VKRALSIVGLTAFGLVFGLLLAEATLRFFPRLMPFALRTDLKVDDEAIDEAHHERSRLLLEDGYLGRVLRPDASLHVEGHPDYTYDIATLSLGIGEGGFRDDGLNGPVYAVTVGDSFTFGDGVSLEQTWVERLEASIGHDVVNEGVPGYSSIQNMRNLAAYSLPLEPEVVIWAFFNNDPADDWAFQAWLASGEPSWGAWQRMQLANEATETDAQAADTDSLTTFLAENSRLYAVANLAAQAADEPYQPYVDDTLDFRFKFDTVWNKYLNADDERVQYGMQLAQFNVLEGQRLAGEQGVELVLALIPFKEQVYWPIVSRYVERPEDYDVDWMTDAMLDFCADNDLTCIDLLPAFRARAEQGEQLYFRTDGHFNEAGHALAAELIEEGLAEHGLLPDA
jgi:hypothetical protein